MPPLRLAYFFTSYLTNAVFRPLAEPLVQRKLLPFRSTSDDTKIPR
jgi:hypothetical protein